MPTSATEPSRIAERVLQLGDATIHVQLATPVQVSDEEWTCAFTITSDQEQHVDHAHGCDSMQALILAIVAMRSQLDARFGDGLDWAGFGSTGIPKVVPQYMGGKIERKLERQMELQVGRIVASLRKRMGDQA